VLGPAARRPDRHLVGATPGRDLAAGRHPGGERGAAPVVLSGHVLIPAGGRLGPFAKRCHKVPATAGPAGAGVGRETGWGKEVWGQVLHQAPNGEPYKPANGDRRTRN